MSTSRDMSFYNKGYTVWDKKSAGTDISWGFTRYTGSLMPFSFFCCEMKALGYSSLGYGCGWSDGVAVEKAFSEAWERIWLAKFEKENSVSINSNGFAAGKTANDANNASREELLERAILIKAWRDMTGWEISKCTSPKAVALLFGLRLRGWKSDFFNIHSDIGTVRACLLRHKTKGAIFDTAMGDSTVNVDDKIALSVAKNTYLARHEPLQHLPVVAGPEHHLRFYSETSNLEAFSFLNNSESKAKVLLGSLHAVKTTLLVDESIMPAVSYSTNSSWPQLNWGQQSVGGVNKWPHPLA